MNTEPTKALYRVRRGKWHTIWMADNPAIVVVERSFAAARAKAEQLFNIVINPDKPEAA